MKKIDFIEYPGSIQNFQALMDRLTLIHRGNWEIASVRYSIYMWPDEKQGSLRIWDIREIIPESGGETDLKLKPRIASIMAAEKFPDRTLVEFIDGVSSVGLRQGFKEENYLGDDFYKIINEIVSECGNKTVQEISQEPRTRNLKDWFDYLHANQHRRRITLNYISNKTGFAYSTVKKKHSLYMKENDIQKVTKSNKK